MFSFLLLLAGQEVSHSSVPNSLIFLLSKIRFIPNFTLPLCICT